MKYLVLFAVVFAFAWHWRNSRTRTISRKAEVKKSATPVDVVACALCGVHSPANESIAGSKGSYCCAAHRNSAEH